MRLRKYGVPSIFLGVLAGAYSPPSLSAADNRDYYVQIGAYKSTQVAETVLKKTLALEDNILGRILKVAVQEQIFYSVQLGPFHSYNEAKEVQAHAPHSVQKGFIRNYAATAKKSLQPKPKSQLTQRKIAQKSLPKSSEKTMQRASSSMQRTTQQYPKEPGPYAGLTLWNRFPYHLRTLGDGTLSETTNFFAGDMLFPFSGNNDWIGFVDGAGKYGEDKAWLGSIGAGWRGILSNQLWGAYLFGDRNVSINNQDFWVLNPGLEWMNTRIDTHLNAYIPISSKTQTIGTFPGNQLGINGAFYFQEHTLYEYLFNILDATGPGLDAEVGYTWNNWYSLRTFVGGYHFNMAEGPSISGVEGGIEFPYNEHISILIHDSYDRVQHNTFMGTLRIVFGAIPKTPLPDVHTRLLDPFQRHLGAYQTGGGIPINTVTKRLNKTLQTNNIWFFNEGGALFNLANGFSNCTYENPCGEFSQSALDGIDTLSLNAKLWVNTGTYNNPLPGTGFTLRSGQNTYGRTQYFHLAATGTNRPILNDTFILSGNNVLENLQINGQTIVNGVRSAISSSATAPVSINNTLMQVNATSGPNVNTVDIRNSALVYITNSEIIGTITGVIGSRARSLFVLNSPVIIGNSSLNTLASSSGGAEGINTNGSLLIFNSVLNTTVLDGGFAVNILHEGGNLIIYNSIVESLFSGGTFTFADNISSQAAGEIKILNSIVNLTATDFATNTGIFGISMANSGSNLLMKNTIANVTGNNVGSITGLNSSGSSIVTNSIIDVLVNAPRSSIRAISGATLTSSSFSITDSLIRAKATNATSNVNIQGSTVSGSGVQMQNSYLLAIADSPATALAVGSGQVNNVNNSTICAIIQNGVLSYVVC